MGGTDEIGEEALLQPLTQAEYEDLIELVRGRGPLGPRNLRIAIREILLLRQEVERLKAGKVEGVE